MAVGYDVLVTGLGEFDLKMRMLDKKVKRKLVRTAVKTGANIIKQQAASNARSMVGGEMGGLLAENLKVHIFRKQKRGSYGVSIWTKPGIMGFIWLTHIGTQHYIPADIEFGHIDKAGGFVPAIPYIRTAFDTKVQAANRAIGRMLGLGLETGVAMEIRNP